MIAYLHLLAVGSTAVSVLWLLANIMVGVTLSRWSYRLGYRRGRIDHLREEAERVLASIKRTQAVLETLHGPAVTDLGGIHARH